MFLKWEKGRQNSGYFKFKIIQSKILKLDIYLLKFPKNSFIKTHKDEVLKGKHFRLNIIIKKAKVGGIFYLEGKKQKGRFHSFRPDIQKHSLSKIQDGTRYVLSIGWIKS